MIVVFRYRFHNSPMERIDPRARWFFSILMLFTITMFWDFRFLAFFFCLSMFWYSLARLTWKETRRVWYFVFFLMSTTIILNTIITSAGTIGAVIQGGHPVLIINWRFIHFTLTVERLWFALCQATRIVSIAGLFIVIPFTMDPRLYGVTFRGIGLPDKVAYSLDLAFRFVPTLARDFQITLDSQRARGFEVEKVQGGLLAQIRKMAPLLVPVTMNAILSGEDTINAMDLRCFGLRARTWIESLTYHWYDFGVIGLGVVLLAVSLVLGYLGYGKFWIPPQLIDWVVSH